MMETMRIHRDGVYLVFLLVSLQICFMATVLEKQGKGKCPPTPEQWGGASGMSGGGGGGESKGQSGRGKVEHDL